MADPYIKFFPSDFLGGTSGLSPAERGVYITLLCLIYEADGPIERNDGRLARRCGAPKAGFLRILTSLIDEGKIIERDGMLTNARAEKAIVDRQNRSQNATIAANERWSAQGQKPKRNQRPKNAGASATQCVDNASPESRVQKEVIEPPTGVSHFDALRAIKTTPDPPVPEVTMQDVVDGWNDLAARCDLPQIRKLSEERRQRLKVRLREYPDIADWKRALAVIHGSPFLRGDNKRGWRADFDFLLQPRSFLRLLEGSYDQTHQ